MCLQPGHAGVDGHGCEAAASQLEPSFAYHMVRALVMAIMTAVVVGLPRGYDRLRKSCSLLPLGGPINCDTTMFFRVSHPGLTQEFAQFKGIIMRLRKNVKIVLHDHRECLVWDGWMGVKERLGTGAHPVS